MPDNQYRPVYQTSLVDPEEFWARAARRLDWKRPPSRVLQTATKAIGRWFTDGRVNTCYNALDRHVHGPDSRATQAALVYESAVSAESRTYTYAELLDEVAACAGMLRGLGVRVGDRVVIYLPMVPQAVIAMLACARLGAVHSVVFGGFAAPELAARITDADPVVVVTDSGSHTPERRTSYPPIVARALEMTTSDALRAVIVKQRPEFSPWRKAATDLRPAAARVRWVDWDETLAHATPAAAVPVTATDPLYILYTSGTTGSSRGVVRDNGGHAVALSWSMRNIYDVGPGQVMWTASDVGWVVGHSYLVYGPLLVGATTVLYEGSPTETPDPGTYWRIVDKHRVRVLFTTPAALRSIHKCDPHAAFPRQSDLSSLRAIFVAGERLDPATHGWATNTLLAEYPDCPVIDHWWQTETGWPICANPLGIQQLPIKPGSVAVPVPGYRVRTLDSSGNPVPPHVQGNIVLGLPLPPGCTTGLWRDQGRYKRGDLAVFPSHYQTGDSGYFDEDGYLYVLGRSDDVINVGGERLSTGTIEAAITGCPGVAESAVVGVPDRTVGQRPLAYVVLENDNQTDPALLREHIALEVRQKVGPIAELDDVVLVSALPKTSSGKVLRKTIREISTGRPVHLPATLEDPAAVHELAQQAEQRSGEGDYPTHRTTRW